MRGMVGALCVLLLSPTVVLGKSLYVSCSREIPLRANTTVEGKTLATLKAGQQVTLVKEEGNYYLVSLPNGAQGYVFKEYLTDHVPVESRLQETQQRIKDLETQAQAQKQEVLTLREERAQLNTNFDKDRAQLNEERAKLDKERAQLEAAKKQAEATADHQTQLAAQLQAQQGTFKRDSKLNWFLAGAGVLLIGWLLGWMWGETRRQNRRRRLS